MDPPNIGMIAKVLVIGDIATGKTSVIRRYTSGTFSDDYQTTIGVDFNHKKVKTNTGEDVSVQLWDIAGQDRFAGLSRIFYNHALAAIIVFDLFSKESFDNAANWKKDVDDKVFLPSGEKIPVLLLGNKDDRLESGNEPVSTFEEINKFAKEFGFYAYYQCSAKSGHNIQEACNTLINKVAQNNLKQANLAAATAEEIKNEEKAATNRISLSNDDNQQQDNGCC